MLSAKETARKETISLLVDAGWAYHVQWNGIATCRWCHREIHLIHGTLISPKGTVYHVGCAVERFNK